MGDQGIPHQITPPDYLNEEYIENVLKKHFKNQSLKLLECNIAPANAAGDHYGSQMFRVRSVIQKGNNKSENFRFIVKIPPVGEFSANFQETRVFEKEADMFVSTLPEMRKYLQKAYPGDEPLEAISYGFELEPDKTLFLEDLRETGYTLGDRFGGIDREHTELVLKSMAKLHASSLAVINNNPGTKEHYDEAVWSEKYVDMFDKMLSSAIEGAIEVVQTFQDGPEKSRFLSKLGKLKENFPLKVVQNYKRNDDVLNVIVHGDCWTNNMMFKYDDNKKLLGMKFVDFQLANYNTPALDLVYFIFTSTRNEFRFNDSENFLKIYHDSFMDTISRLNIKLDKPFSLKDLKDEFNKRLLFGLSCLISVFPITIIPSDKAPNIDEIAGGSTGKNSIYVNDTMAETLRIAIPFFENLGVI